MAQFFLINMAAAIKQTVRDHMVTRIERLGARKMRAGERRATLAWNGSTGWRKGFGGKAA